MPFVYDEKWSHIKQIARITRTREIRGVATTTTALLITSLTAAQATPQRLLELNRNHWGIENRLHWVRDVVLGEDAAKSRQGNAPQNLATLNSFVAHFLFKTFASFTKGIQLCQRRTSNAIQSLLDFIE
jgi:predicted transposase YbfD/YdcC